MLGIFQGKPAVCDERGVPVIVFMPRGPRHYHGWSRAIREAVELSRELDRPKITGFVCGIETEVTA